MNEEETKVLRDMADNIAITFESKIDQLKKLKGIYEMLSSTTNEIGTLNDFIELVNDTQLCNLQIGDYELAKYYSSIEEIDAEIKRFGENGDKWYRVRDLLYNTPTGGNN